MKLTSKEVPHPNPVDVHQRLLEVVKFSKQSFVAMGALLYDLYNEERYLETVGAGIDTWEDYLRQPEIGLSTKEASRLMQIYEVFCLKFGFSETKVSEVPIKNLHYLLPVAKRSESESEVAILLDDAKHLTQTDFRERIYDVKTEEEGERTYTYLLMQRCNETGTLRRVPGVESEELVEVFRDRLNE